MPLTPEERLARKRARDKRYKQANKAKINAAQRRRRARNIEAARAKERAAYQRKRPYAQQYYQDNKVRCNANSHAWKAANRDRVNAIARNSYHRNQEKCLARMKAWREANPDKAKDASNRWRLAHPDAFQELQLAWRAANPDRINFLITRRRARLAGVSRNDLTKEQRQLVIDSRHGVCDYCPYYNPNCATCKRGAHALTLDHITPIADQGDNTLWNVTACCKSCNSKKKDNPPPGPVQPFLL